MTVVTAVTMVAKVVVNDLGYDLGYEDRDANLGANFMKLGMLYGYKFVKKKKEQRMQTQGAR